MSNYTKKELVDSLIFRVVFKEDPGINSLLWNAHFEFDIKHNTVTPLNEIAKHWESSFGIVRSLLDLDNYIRWQRDESLEITLKNQVKEL